MDKAIRYIKKNNGTKFLALFHSDEKYEKILDKGGDFIMLKINISDVYSHKYTKVKINFDDYLPLEKTLNNILILVRSVFNKNIIIISIICFLKNVFINDT